MLTSALVWAKKNPDGTYLTINASSDLKTTVRASFAFTHNGKLFTVANGDLSEHGNFIPPYPDRSQFPTAMEVDL